MSHPRGNLIELKNFSGVAGSFDGHHVYVDRYNIGAWRKISSFYCGRLYRTYSVADEAWTVLSWDTQCLTACRHASAVSMRGKDWQSSF